MTTNLQIYVDEFQALTPNQRNFLTERWKRLMLLSKKAQKTEFIRELEYILENTTEHLRLPLTIVEEYYQSGYESLPILSKGDMRRDILKIDLRFMEMMYDLSKLLKLEIVPHSIEIKEGNVA